MSHADAAPLAASRHCPEIWKSWAFRHCTFKRHLRHQEPCLKAFSLLRLDLGPGMGDCFSGWAEVCYGPWRSIDLQAEPPESLRTSLREPKPVREKAPGLRSRRSRVHASSTLSWPGCLFAVAHFRVFHLKARCLSNLVDARVLAQSLPMTTFLA